MKLIGVSLFLAFIFFSPEGKAVEAIAKKKANSSVEEMLRFKAGDEKGNEVKALKTELLVQRSEKRALAQLQKLLKKYQGTAMEPDLLLRMAELYMRRARTQRFFEIHKDSNDEVATFAPQLVKEASEAKEIRKAIAIYDQIQMRYKNFRSMDLVLFNCSYARQQLGEDNIAEQLLRKLIKNFPDSGLVPDAHLAIGEINYNHRRFNVALENFREIRHYPDSRVYPYGLYKAAWSLYNLQDAASGMKELEDVVSYGRDAARTDRDAKLDLRKEALSDLALFYLDVQLAKDAVGYFLKQSQELDATPYLLRLVGLYKRGSRLSDVETVLVDVLAKVPESEHTARIHDELIWNYENLKKRSQAAKQMIALDKFCSSKVQIAVDLAIKQKVKGEITRLECQDKLTEASKKLATKWHSLWRELKIQQGDDLKSDLSANSEVAYQLFLKNASSADPELAKVHFAYAELLFKESKFDLASEHYAKINSYRDSQPQIKLDSKLGHDAAFAAIYSLQLFVKDQWSSDGEKKFIELSNVYFANYPNGEHTLELKFKRAFIAYEKERYVEAAPLLRDLGWMKIPKNFSSQDHEKVQKAQDLYLDILNLQKDYRALRLASKSLLDGKLEDKRKLQMEKIYREAYFSEVQQLEEKGQWLEAVPAYKTFAQENKESELAAKAWWNASQIQFKTSDLMGGSNTCIEMVKLFPKSPNIKECVLKAAQSFESLARLDLASTAVLTLVDLDVSQERHWREVAADFKCLSGQLDACVKIYIELVNIKDQKREEKIRLLERAYDASRLVGDQTHMSLLKTKLIELGAEPWITLVTLEQGEAALEKGDQTKAFNLTKKIIGREGLPKDILARARFVQAQVLEDEYRRQSVKAQVDRIGIVLAIKTEKLEKAQKAYQSAIRYNDPLVSVKALRRLAHCYLDYSKSVRNMSLPAEVPEADQQAFKSEIEQLSIPMEEKGIEAMSQALDVAKKAQLRNGEIANIQLEIDELNLAAKRSVANTISMPEIYVPVFSIGNWGWKSGGSR